jgi:DNA repair exonuclease SbcCD ATPase subunit
VESTISTVRMKIEHKADMIKKIEEKSDSQLESYKKSAEEEQESLQSLLERKATLQSEIAALAESVASVDKQRDSISQMTALRKQMQGNVKKVQDERTFYEQNDECPVCKHGLPDEFRQDMIGKKEARETELALALQKMERMLEDARTKLDIANVVVKQIDEKRQESHKTDSAIASSKKYLKQLQELAEKVQREKGSIQTERDAITTLQAEEDAAEGQKKEFVEDLHTMEIATVLLKDSGIKRKIIRKYIPALNKIINKYLISIKILQGMGGSSNIFVISHKSDQLLDKFQNILTYKKVNNFSKLC